MYIKTLSVSELNSYIKKMFDADFILNNTYIKGEISNFKFHTSGHLYFSLKDDNSRIRAVMFRSFAENLTFLPQDGMRVIVKGRVSVYQKDGTYEIICSEMKIDGVGAFYAAFEKLKNKLQKEGIFDEKHKKSIPKYAEKIGVITSPTGAAVRDIINVTRRRNKSLDIIIYPSLVQGIEASKSIIDGINYFNSRSDIDIIIIARGGGSIEELQSFNDEDLALSVYNSKIPIISGVGHETDFTIIDFVSDRRAPTPSAAAEIAVWDEEEYLNKVNTEKYKINTYIENIIQSYVNRNELLLKRIEINSPLHFIVEQYASIDSLRQRLTNSISKCILKNEEEVKRYKIILHSNAPCNILKKGYAIIYDDKDNIIKSAKCFKKDKDIRIMFNDGSVDVHASVKSKK